MISFRPSTTSACADCGTSLSGGACPACALGFLLEGMDPEDAAAVEGQAASLTRASEEAMEFGRYTLKKRLASGGMGIIYVAEDRKLKRTVALKMIRGSSFANEAELARFTIEAEAAAGLDHPNIVPIYEVGRLDGQPFFTMKLIEGQSLGERLRGNAGQIPAREAAMLLSRIARAVHHAHQRGILHRDLKPANILIDHDGVPWLTDFGLAKITHADSCLTLTTDHLGTPHYMSPEVAGGTTKEVSTASDVWALGVILWEIICGVPPFHGASPVEIMRRIVEQEPSWPGGSRGNEDLITLARRCMEKDPSRRPVSAGEFADELDRWLRGEPIRARRITRRERFVKWARRKPALAALYAALAVGGIGTLVLWQRAEHAVVSLTQSNDQLGQALRISAATKLAGDARLQIRKDPARALMLAVEAVEVTRQQSGGVLPEASSALFEVLQEAGGHDISPDGAEKSSDLPGHVSRGAAEEWGCRISPDGKWLLALDWSNSAEKGIRAGLFDLRERKDFTPVRRWVMYPPHGAKNFRGMWWMHDSQHILSAMTGGEIRMWNIAEPASPAAPASTGTNPPASTLIGNIGQPGHTLRSFKLRFDSEPGSEGMSLFWSYDVSKGTPDPLCDDCFQKHWSGKGSFTPDAACRIPLPRERDISSSTAISPDGRWLFTWGGDSTTNALLQRIGPGGQIGKTEVLPEGTFRMGYVAYSPDSRFLIIHREPALARIYDLGSLDAEKAAATGRVLCDRIGGCSYIGFSADSSLACVVGVGDQVRLQPLDPSGPGITLRTGGERNISCGFSPDGKWMFAGGHDRVLRVWRVAGLKEGELPLEFRGLPTPVMDAVMTSDGRSLIATGFGGTFRLWEFNGVGTGTLPLVVGGSGSVKEIAISPDAKWIGIACSKADGAAEKGEEGDVLVASAEGGASWKLTPHKGQATGIAFSRDGKWLASTGKDQKVQVFDFPAVLHAIAENTALPGPRFVFGMEKTRWLYDRHLAFHPRGILYCACGDGILFEWDLNQPDPVSSCKEHEVHSIHYLLPAVEVSPDGHWLAVARHGWDVKPEDGSTQYGNLVLLFDVSKPGPPVPYTELRAPFLIATSLTFSPNSRWLATGAAGAKPAVWDLSAKNIAASRRTGPRQAFSLPAVAFAPDRPWLAVGGSDGLVYLWDWEKSSKESIVFFAADSVRSLKWLPDGRLVGCHGGEAVIWETDLPDLVAMARKVAGRKLTREERDNFRVSIPVP